MIIGLDVGGTHTDVVLLGESGLERRVKVLTDTNALFRTVLTGLERITEGVVPEQISHAVLSTTLTTNAIVEKKTPPVGMIISGGPGLSPEFFRIGDHFHIVAGAIDHSGMEIQPVDENEIHAVAEKLKSKGIRYVGVVGKFSARNPAHELQIAQHIAPMFEKVFIGHRTSGNFSFPRRIVTTFLNASVYPVHRRFFEAVQSSLTQKGITVPIYILKADGGTMDFETSIDFPGQSILSGPAASVMGSVAFADSGAETIVLDIGGTTTDMAVLIDRVPVLAPSGIEIDDYKTLIRALHTHSVGLGGDSAVRVAGEAITIGPDRIGPAMAYGGHHPTPSDALFVLGKATDGNREAAEKGISKIAEALGISTKAAAYKIFDQTCRQILLHARNMVDRINSKPVYTVREALKGHRVNPDRILVLGGPAPYFAEHFQTISDYSVQTVPQWDVANAIGTALSRTTCEVTLFADTAKGEAAAPEEVFSEKVSSGFTAREAREMALQLLRQKAVKQGADIEDLETDILESLEFNMIRNFRMIGKNIRIRLQVRPGLIHHYREIVTQLDE